MKPPMRPQSSKTGAEKRQITRNIHNRLIKGRVGTYSGPLTASHSLSKNPSTSTINKQGEGKRKSEVNQVMLTSVDTTGSRLSNPLQNTAV